MKKILLLSLVGIVALVAAACSGGGDHGSMDMGSTTTTTAVPSNAEFNQADVTFAQGMVVHHAQAIDMAQLAETRNPSPQVQDLAARIKAAQGPEIQQLSGWLTSWNQAVPNPADAMAHGAHGGSEGMMTAEQMTQLEAASGADFDRLFLEMMIVHHEGAVAMANQEIGAGKYQPAVAMAREIIRAQQGEIAEMDQLLGRP